MIPPHLELIYALAWVAVCLLALISQATMLVIAYFRLDQLEANFNASHMKFNREKGNSPFGRMKRVWAIAALTGSPSFILMQDPLAYIEAELMPEHLKNLVKTPRYILRTALAVCGLLVIWYCFEWLHLTLSRPVGELKLLYIATLISCFTLAVLAVFARIYISLFKLDKLETFLRNSYYVGRNHRELGNTLFGRYRRLAHISNMLLLGDKFLSKCDPDAIDNIARLPLPLRRLVTIPTGILAYSIAGFGLLIFVVDFFRIID